MPIPVLHFDEFLLSHEERHFTGKKRYGFYVRLGSKQLSFQKKPGFSDYTALAAEYPVRLTENFYLPLSFGTIRYEEYETYTENYTIEEARLLAENRLTAYLEKLMEKGVQIAGNNVKIEVGSGVCRASGTIAALEEISQAVPTEILEEPGQPDAAKNEEAE